MVDVDRVNCNANSIYGYYFTYFIHIPPATFLPVFYSVAWSPNSMSGNNFALILASFWGWPPTLWLNITIYNKHLIIWMLKHFNNNRIKCKHWNWMPEIMPSVLSVMAPSMFTEQLFRQFIFMEMFWIKFFIFIVLVLSFRI